MITRKQLLNKFSVLFCKRLICVFLFCAVRLRPLNHFLSLLWLKDIQWLPYHQNIFQILYQACTSSSSRLFQLLLQSFSLLIIMLQPHWSFKFFQNCSCFKAFVLTTAVSFASNSFQGLNWASSFSFGYYPLSFTQQTFILYPPSARNFFKKALKLWLQEKTDKILALRQSSGYTVQIALTPPPTLHTVSIPLAPLVSLQY